MFGRKQPQRKRPVVDTPRSSTVFSYHASKPSNDSKMVRETATRRKAASLQNLPFFLALLGIAASFTYMMTLSTDPKVIIVGKEQADIVHRNAASYYEATKKSLNKSLLNRTKFSINIPEIENTLKDQFPELSSVEVDVSLLRHRPVVLFSSQPAILSVQTPSGTLIVNREGKAILTAQEFADTHKTLKLIPVIDQSGFEAKIGQRVMTGAQMHFITILEQQLREKGFEIESILLPAEPSELHLRLINQAYYVKFNFQLDARQSVGTFLAARQRLAADNINPSEYMDARVEETIYYR